MAISWGGVTDICPFITISSFEFNNFVMEEYDSVYYNQSAAFYRPPLHNIGRTVKADSHSPAVIIKDNNMKERQNPKDIIAIDLLRKIIPEGSSSGTGYSQYAELCITYDTGEKIETTLSYWHETLNMVFAQLYDDLPSIPNPKKAHQLLSNALKGLVKESDYEELDYKYRRPKTSPSLNLPPELEGKKFRIRKLTPRECFRLMDVEEDDIDKMQAAGLSNSSQYRLAGNSIVVNVLYHIFRKLYTEPEMDMKPGTQLTLF